MKAASRILLLCLAALPAWSEASGFVHGREVRPRVEEVTALRAPSLASPVALIRLGAPAKSAFARTEADDKRVRVGFARDVALEREAAPPSALAWTALADGAHVARVGLASPGAAALRLALRARGLPASAELRFFSPYVPDRVIGPVSAAAVDAATLAAGSYWSPVTEGNEQQVEAWLPPGADPARVSIEVVAASHITVAPARITKSTGVGAAQACEEDVVCVASGNPALERAARSVAKLLYTENGVSYLCTGTLVADASADSQVPYLYTAAHCIDSQAAAATLNTFWFFQAAACGAKSASGYKQLAGGATLLYANAATDAALVRLADPAPQGAWFAGWVRAPLETDAALVALHHPAGDLKKVSLGRPVGLVAGFTEVAWTSGTTEGGSSGSGLFTFRDGEYVLRGALRGGSASCGSSGKVADPANRDYYSRIDQEAPQLAKWLSGAPAPLANYGGMWFDPQEPGWGMSIAQSAENHVFATWYGYDSSSRPTWLVVPQVTWTSAAAFEGAVYRASGSAYDQPYDAARFKVSPVGTMRVEFAADGTARVSATFDGTPFVRTIQRQPF